MVGSLGITIAVMTNWQIGFAERVFIQGYPVTKNGGIGTLFAYADEGLYIITAIKMHTRYSNIASKVPNYNVPVVVGGICGYSTKSFLFIIDVVIDFLSTAITNAGLIMGNKDVATIIYIWKVRSETDTKYAKSQTAF